jgi:hypothetical protein
MIIAPSRGRDAVACFFFLFGLVEGFILGAAIIIYFFQPEDILTRTDRLASTLAGFKTPSELKTSGCQPHICLFAPVQVWAVE